MKKMMKKQSKPLRREDKRPLIKCSRLPEDEDNPTRNMEYKNSYMENALNINHEVQIRPCDLVETLRISHVVLQEGPEAIVEGQPRGLMCCEAQNDDKLLQTCYHLIEVSVDKHFPYLPTGGDVNQLEDYLIKMQTTVLRELLRLAPLLPEAQLLRNVIACYHRRTFDTLHRILQHVNTIKQAFAVVDWVLHTYLSKELLGHPDLWNESIQAVDFLLLTDWISQAERKLLDIVQNDLFTSLGRILENEDSSRQVCVSVDETFVHLHLDVIQCINAVLKIATIMSQTLKLKVQRICWEELHDFVEKYVTVKRKGLKEKSIMGKSGTMHLFKITNTCKELSLYVSVIAVDYTSLHADQTISLLKELEALALKLLMDTQIELAQKTLAKYFEGVDHLMENLKKDIEEYFKDLPKHLDTQKTVIDKAYQHIVSLYLQNLVQSNYRKLFNRWDDIGERVTQDAEFLHVIFSGLNPDVKQRNLILLKVAELLNCGDVESLKITVCVILRDCFRIGTEHLPALLRWKGGLSRRQIQEVLEASQDVYPTDTSVPWYGCILCC